MTGEDGVQVTLSARVLSFTVIHRCIASRRDSGGNDDEDGDERAIHESDSRTAGHLSAWTQQANAADRDGDPGDQEGFGSRAILIFACE